MPRIRSGNELKAVAFDLGDTLVEYEGVPLNWEALYPEALANLAAFLGVAANAEQLVRASEVLRRYNTRLHPRVEEVAFARILSGLARCFGVERELEELAAARAFFRVFRRRLRCFPDTRPALAGLRSRGLRLGVFTDVPYGMPSELVEEDLRVTNMVGVFDAFLTSRDVGVRKPAVATLQALARQLGCAPSAMMHVGNERKDIDVARAFGCRAVLLDRARAGVQWGQDQTINSLAEL